MASASLSIAEITRELVRRLRRRDPAAPVIMAGSYVDRHSTVGAYTYIGKHCMVSKASVGRYCSIADHVSIGPGEHPIDAVSTSTMFVDDPYALLTRLPCTVGHDVWLGVGSTIRRGVSVGNGAVVGAHSFVNQDVPPFAIVAGTPAKLIRYRFPPERIAAIEASRWWDVDPVRARAIHRDLV